MNKLFELFSHIAAAIGILVCLGAGIGRLLGYYYLLGFEGMTLFNVGIGAMVLACLLKLYQLSAR